MKILFVISCNGGGNGGHNHSLNHLSQALSQTLEVKIVSIGLTEVPILKSNPYYEGKIEFKWYNIFTLNKRINQVIKNFNPDVIHCFDGASALVLMVQPVLLSKKIIYTKCGGPNERKYFSQVASDVILFSHENYLSYKSNMRFKDSELHLIPNRVNVLEQAGTDTRTYKKDSECFNFVRICRIGITYYDSIIQSITLVQELNKFGTTKIKLLLIGKVEDEKVYTKVLSYSKDNRVEMTIITGEFALEASRLLYLADAVIGTGRGVMEALSIGLPTFATQRDHKIPTLIREENFDELFANNFSPRSTFKKFNLEDEINLSIELVKKKDFYQKNSFYAKKISEDNFLINNKIIRQYLALYSNVIKKPKKYWWIRNIIPLLYYVNNYRKSQKSL